MVMFKAGELIICVNNNGNPNSILVIGKTYKVKFLTNPHSPYLELEGLAGSWGAYRFTKADMENV